MSETTRESIEAELHEAWPIGWSVQQVSSRGALARWAATAYIEGGAATVEVIVGADGVRPRALAWVQRGDERRAGTGGTIIEALGAAGLIPTVPRRPGCRTTHYACDCVLQWQGEAVEVLRDVLAGNVDRERIATLLGGSPDGEG